MYCLHDLDPPGGTAQRGGQAERERQNEPIQARLAVVESLMAASRKQLGQSAASSAASDLASRKLLYSWTQCRTRPRPIRPPGAAVGPFTLPEGGVPVLKVVSSFLSAILHPLASASAPTRQGTARYPRPGVVCCGGMPERDPQSAGPRPEKVFTTQEAEVLRKAEAGVLPCPWCGQMLRANMMVSGDYQGVLLSCPDRGSCGFREC